LILGLALKVIVHPVNIQDSDGRIQLLTVFAERFLPLVKLFTDVADQGVAVSSGGGESAAATSNRNHRHE
jgi:hypothetical protein